LEEGENEAPSRRKRQMVVKYFGDNFSVYLVDDAPTTISEAMHLEMETTGWKHLKEMDSILDNGTCELIKRFYGCKLVGRKQVFTRNP
jgi:hypothetical protein